MLVCLEGNIGAGKSSVLDALRADYDVIPEPIERWGSLLALHYADAARWSLPFNTRVLLSMHPPPTSGIVERSPSATRYVFGQIAYNMGTMAPDDFGAFKAVHDRIGWEPDAFVYLDTPVDVCFTRMQSRARTCEANLTVESLQKIAFQYAQMFKSSARPVVTVDGTGEPADVVERVRQAIRKLEAGAPPG
jgi:thymidylate kinase